jgi:hypothetical protein
MKRPEDLIAGVMRDFMRNERRAELADIRKDPKANRLTRIMGPKGDSYRYADGGADHVDRRVWFCWACHRNAAGYWLAWKEVRGGKNAQRSAWTSHDTKKAARAFSERWANEHREKIKHEKRTFNY